MYSHAIRCGGMVFVAHVPSSFHWLLLSKCSGAALNSLPAKHHCQSISIFLIFLSRASLGRRSIVMRLFSAPFGVLVFERCLPVCRKRIFERLLCCDCCR